MRWLTNRPPPRSRQSSPTKLSMACSTVSVETASECDSSDPATEVLMVDGPRSPRGFPRDDGGDGGGDLSRVHEEYRPNPFLHNRGKSFAAATWMRSTRPSLEKLPRLGPWRRRAWLIWLSALDWRTCSTLSTSGLGSGSLSPVDGNFSRLHLRYTILRFRTSLLRPELQSRFNLPSQRLAKGWSRSGPCSKQQESRILRCLSRGIGYTADPW